MYCLKYTSIRSLIMLLMLPYSPAFFFGQFLKIIHIYMCFIIPLRFIVFSIFLQYCYCSFSFISFFFVSRDKEITIHTLDINVKIQLQVLADVSLLTTLMDVLFSFLPLDYFFSLYLMYCLYYFSSLSTRIDIHRIRL